MKTVNFTKFGKKASGLISQLEKGEQIILARHGKPVAEVIPNRRSKRENPHWRCEITPLEVKGEGLSSAILEEREAE